MDPPQTPPLPNFSQKPKFHIFFEAFPKIIILNDYNINNNNKIKKTSSEIYLCYYRPNFN